MLMLALRQMNPHVHPIQLYMMKNVDVSFIANEPTCLSKWVALYIIQEMFQM